MPVLGVVTVNVDKSFIESHATQLRQFAVDIFREQYVVDRHRREPVATVKVERLTRHVLAVGRATDDGVMSTASAAAVLFAVHRYTEDLPDMLDQLFKLLCWITQTTAAVALELAPLKMRAYLLIKIGHF